MNKIKIIIILFSFLMVNCQKRARALQNNSKIENSDTYNENKYKEVNFQVKKINNNDSNTEMYMLHHYKLILNSETEKSEIIFNNSIYPIDLNFTYGTNVNEVLGNIKIFQNNMGNEIILIPSFVLNDKITYQVILLKDKILYDNTISYSLLSNSSDSKKIEVYEEKGYFNFKLGKISVKTQFTKQLNSLEKNSTNTEEKTFPSDLIGTWAVFCPCVLTELDINKSEGFLSLYDFNAIYINLKVEKSLKRNEYILKYASVSSQKDYYDDRLKIVDEDIDKNKPIGKLTILADGKARLDWIGLYNIKKQKLEFVGEDFLLISENGGKLPLILEKCD